MNAEPRPDEREQDDANFAVLWVIPGLCLVAAVWLLTFHFAPIDKAAFDRAKDVSRAQDADVELRCRMTVSDAARRGMKPAPSERCTPESPPPDPHW